MPTNAIPKETITYQASYGLLFTVANYQLFNINMWQLIFLIFFIPG